MVGWYINVYLNVGEGYGGCSFQCPLVKFSCGISYSQMVLASIVGRWETVDAGSSLKCDG